MKKIKSSTIKASLTIPLMAILILGAPQAIAKQRQKPEDTVRAYLAAVEKEQMEAFVRFTHPDVHDQIKNWLISGFQISNQINRLPEITKNILGQERTLDELHKMSATDMLAQATKFYKEALVKKGIPLTEFIKFNHIDIVGVLKEGEKRHVLTRLDTHIYIPTNNHHIKMHYDELITLLPYDGGWRIGLGLKAVGTDKLKERIMALLVEMHNKHKSQSGHSHPHNHKTHQGKDKKKTDKETQP